MGIHWAASGANHCASTKATAQLTSDSTSYTSPRQAPSTKENSKTARKIQSKVGIGRIRSEFQDGGGQVQLLELVHGLFRLGLAGKRSDAYPGALGVFGAHHLGVGLEAGLLYLLARFAQLGSLH